MTLFLLSGGYALMAAKVDFSLPGSDVIFWQTPMVWN